MLKAAIALAVLALFAAPAASPTGPGDPCYGMVTCGQLVFTFDSAGDGAGTVTASPGAINCRSVAGGDGVGSCSGYVRSASADQVTANVAITPDVGSYAECFSLNVGFKIDCPTNVTVISACGVPCAYLVRVTFTLYPYLFRVSTSGVGTGNVALSSSGGSCGVSCFKYGTRLTVSALPDKGAVFQGWTGACAGQGPECSLTITSDLSTNAVFGLAPPPTTTTTVTTTTTTVTTTTVPTATTPVPPRPLSARLVSVGVDGHGSARLIHVRLRVSKRARAEVRLLRIGFERYRHVFPVDGGLNVLVGRLPRGLARGQYTLVVAVVDGSGAQRRYSKLISVPA